MLGFLIDPVSGYWAKNEDDGDDTLDPTASPRQWLVPSVQDRKNALLFEPTPEELTEITLATVQHALLRGVEAVFQLEEGEILAEPMPTRDARNGFLLYEATEGGAGVLTRLVAEPASLAQVARTALQVMHFAIDDDGPLPERASALVDQPDTACVAACYRCLMSYYSGWRARRPPRRPRRRPHRRLRPVTERRAGVGSTSCPEGGCRRRTRIPSAPRPMATGSPGDSTTSPWCFRGSIHPGCSSSRISGSR